MTDNLCYCGKELTGRQTKFCSRECSNRYYHHNVVVPAKPPADYCSVCGEPVPAGRSKYCSQACSDAVWKPNGANAVPRKRRYDPVRYDDAAPVELPPLELAARNRQLAAYGRRICSQHFGVALTLDHFDEGDDVCQQCRREAAIDQERRETLALQRDIFGHTIRELVDDRQLKVKQGVYGDAAVKIKRRYRQLFGRAS